MPVRETRNCVECGREFVPSYHRRWLCSETCGLIRSLRADEHGNDVYLHNYRLHKEDVPFVMGMRHFLIAEAAAGMDAVARVLRDGVTVGNVRRETPFADMLDELDYFQRRAVEKLNYTARKSADRAAKRLLSEQRIRDSRTTRKERAWP